MEPIKIDGKIIGENYPVFIIAEAGVNHNGDFKLAKKLIDAANEAGADAVKFQTFKSENVTSKYTSNSSYAERNIGKKETMLEMIKKLEISYDNFKKLKRYCDEKGIIFLSTPHSDDAIEFLEPLMPLYKIPSPDITNIPFLKAIAKKRKPIILSTGIATMKEVTEAVELIKKEGNNKIILMQCTTNYPCKLEDVNLRAMQTLRKKTGLLVGFSDHTIGIEASMLAVKLGAVVIERHFTLNKALPGPDHKASLSPDELKKLVKAISNKDYKIPPEKEELILGSSYKKPTAAEKEIAKVIRKSIIAKVKIPKGAVITGDMLIIKRPGTGIPSKDIDKVIGKIALEDIKQDRMISWKKIK
ncbi:MAG: N-acetylneuraminate synthase [Candidatus Nanoarchaeia archaeon]|nr:N-acetylneuraminate synthase [Candidatus Nanoarchaeia archaeon]